MAYIPPNANGQATKANSSPVVLASDQDALPLSTGAATSAKQDTGNTSLSNIDTSTAAVNTVLGAKGDAKSTATDTTAVTIMQVLKQISASVQAPPSQAVTNAGTFVVQATLAAETTKVIGAINNLPATVDTNSGSKSASTLRMVLATDQPALTTAGLISVKTDQTTHGTTDLVAADVTKLAGTAVDTNSGSKSAGTLRVVLATDQPQLTNKLLVTPDANSAINNAQIGGNTISTDVGATGNGTQRMVLANGAGRTLLSAGGSASSSGNNTLVAAGTNKLKVYAFSLSTTSTTAMTCIFQSGASGTELWRVVLQAPTSISTGANLVVQPPAWLFATASATLLNLNLSSANAVHWSVSYFDEA